MYNDRSRKTRRGRSNRDERFIKSRPSQCCGPYDVVHQHTPGVGVGQDQLPRKYTRIGKPRPPNWGDGTDDPPISILPASAPQCLARISLRGAISTRISKD